MSYKAAMNTIKSLAMSQGFYGRLLQDLQENEDMQMSLQQWCDNHPNADGVDLVMAIEG